MNLETVSLTLDTADLQEGQRSHPTLSTGVRVNMFNESNSTSEQKLNTGATNAEVMPTREAAAYHEAGHAIVTFANGLGVSFIGIGTDEEGRLKGWCDQEYATKIGMGTTFGGFASSQALAGIVAERMFAGEPNIAHLSDQIINLVSAASLDPNSYWKHDAESANLIAYGATNFDLEKMPEVIVNGWRHADSSLQKFWPAVEVLATAILEKGGLSKKEIAETVNAVMPGLVKLRSRANM